MEETKTTIKRIGGYLHRVVPIMDKSGEVLSYALKPLMVEFRPRDVFQVVIGSSIMAIPVALTEEVWVLGETLATINVMAIAALSLLFVSAFVFFNFYRFNFKQHRFEFLKRVLGTYLISALVVAILLTIIQKCPWGIDNIVAVKRIVIVSFPAVMSATLSDTIK
ncbi:MAG: DUF2391 family protein [Flavobacteriales bacterium]